MLRNSRHSVSQFEMEGRKQQVEITAVKCSVYVISSNRNFSIMSIGVKRPFFNRHKTSHQSLCPTLSVQLINWKCQAIICLFVCHTVFMKTTLKLAFNLQPIYTNREFNSLSVIYIIITSAVL